MLEILCEDKTTGLQAVLQYGVFEDVDVITRSVKVINEGEETIYLGASFPNPDQLLLPNATVDVLIGKSVKLD